METERLGSTCALMLFLGILLVYLALLPPAIHSIDEFSMLAVAQSIVARGDVAVGQEVGFPGADGKLYSPWYPLLSVLAVPFVAVGRLLAFLCGLPERYVCAVTTLPLNAILTAGTAVLTARVALLLGAKRSMAMLAAVGFAFSTIALVYGRSLFAEPLLAFLAVASLHVLFSRSPARHRILAVTCCLAILAKPTGLIIGMVACGYVVLRGRRREILYPAAGTVVGLLMYFIYNQWRFGHWLIFGHAWEFSLSTLPEALAGFAISPGRGALWYSPPVVAAIIGARAILRHDSRERRCQGVAVLAIFLLFVLGHSVWSLWHGGWSWGPRLLHPAIPGLLALGALTPDKWRRPFIVLVILGFLVNAPTLIIRHQRWLSEAAQHGISESTLIWSPKHAAAIRIWDAGARQIRDAMNSDVRQLVREAGTPDRTIEGGQAMRILGVWWWMLPLAGIPRWLGALVCLAMACWGSWLIIRAFRASADDRQPPAQAGVVT